jgi:hypothetical protein
LPRSAAFERLSETFRPRRRAAPCLDAQARVTGPMPPRLEQPIERRTLAIIVNDEPGVVVQVRL